MYIAFLLSLILVASCTPGEVSPDGAIAVTDDAGRVVSLPAPARRVFSLIPSLTESVAALDPGLLIGRTRFDRAPDLAHLPSLGDAIRPNLEALAGLRPDLVISWADPGQGTVAERVEALGIGVYRAEPQTIADVRSHLRRLGTLTGRRERAETLISSLDRGLANVAAAVRDREPVDVYYSVWHDPPQTTGPGTFIDEVITHAGGRNVFGDAPRQWPRVSLEAIVLRDPDALVIPVQAGRESSHVLWLEGPGWRELRAVRTGRYLLADGDLFNRPGFRVAEAAALMAHFLHGVDLPPDGTPQAPAGWDRH